MIEDMAKRLQATLDARGIALPIVDARRNSSNEGTANAIVISGYGGGDMYSGGSWTDMIDAKVVRGDGSSFSLTFSVTEHEWSGQCDQWQVEIKGAHADEIAAIRELFHPRQREGMWNNHIEPSVIIDGVRRTF